MSDRRVTCKRCHKEMAEDDIRKHQWTYHPKNNMERAWAEHAKEGFRNWNGSTYYESYGPYY